ncbi:MAG: DUF4179 domain-containing protein [Eubacteriales bacterium]|nr:DUF4179 domain-containing protein [Eubacteriales bacterium]
MTRMEEYQELLQELETPSDASMGTLGRAEKRLQKRRRILRPAAGLAACFALFVLLVNFCTPVAYACEQIPGLRQLARAVTFSRSLTDAVDNDYVQPLHLWQKDGDVVAIVEYLIVDQKQVNVFYRLDSDVHERLAADPQVRGADGGSPPPCSWSLNQFDVKNGELQSLTIDFIDEDVPDALRLRLDVYDNAPADSNVGDAGNADSRVPDADIGADASADDNAGEADVSRVSAEDALLESYASTPDYIARFDFLLEFDPEFTSSGRTVPVDQTVTLDGQSVTLTDINIYPTHLRLNVEADEDNTKWLKRLDFYIEMDYGMRFDPVNEGITATSSSDLPMMTSYRADSSYFYKAKHLKVVITGAEWLDKDMERVRVDLASQTAGRLPDGVELAEATRKDGSWILKFRARSRRKSFFHQLFAAPYYDPDGREYSLDSWQNGLGDSDTEEESGFFYTSFALKDYPYDEVWLSPQYTAEWTAPEPLVVEIQ